MKNIIFIISFVCLLAKGIVATEFQHFITCDGDRLMDGEREFRFVSFNIPNLHYVEDDMRFDRRISFRLPDEFEIDDALETIRQMGGQVARTYTLSVFKADEQSSARAGSLCQFLSNSK